MRRLNRPSRYGRGLYIDVRGSAALMNPYASYIAGKDAIQSLNTAPEQFKALFQKLGPEGLMRSLGPGKWSAGAIFAHLADTEIAFSFRFRQAQADAHHVIQPFDQDAWSIGYDARSAEEALSTFTALRRWNIGFLRSLPSEAFAKEVTHPERGTMTFQVLVESLAGHDLNHVEQLSRIASRV